jgi:hypothetical protein
MIQLTKVNCSSYICCLNTIESQQEISTTKEINYLLNLPNHKTSHDFIYIPW